MHIAIDITPLSTGHSGRGIGSYTKNLVEALQKYETRHTYSLFTRGQKIPNNANLVHYPYFDPFFLTLPLYKPKPTIVTVHDLIPLVFPDKFPAGAKGALKWQVQKLSLKGAKGIITDSECSKRDISKITGINAAKIDRIYLAPSIFHKERQASSKPYVLYVGDVNWNKNVPGLIRALAALKTVFAQRQSSLVLVGNAFLDDSIPETKEINRLVSSLGIENNIERVGHVSHEKLAELYSGALALVQPSFYEGFGLPVLEAMACGCPVVSTRNSSLAEIAGPSIEITLEVESIAAGIKKILTIQRDSQVKKQFDWLKQFTWKRTAAETVASYEKAIDYHPGI